MGLTKDDSEVNLANSEADPEFLEWKWANPEEVIEQAVDYKRPSYEEVIRAFKPYFNWNCNICEISIGKTVNFVLMHLWSCSFS
ncbi:Nudix hydrolase [Quillaja saponaria]|uniref:Nudix hydrolase n=1 Tax=Quillaja saponaria TaxID=32244 RepID=A0AAD7LPY1_QUISA|nr:Nudix hydrolase [Quillaja saponaria]